MRCPKCGYISFDHLEKCLKCNKDIKATSNSLFGSIYNLHVPNFLQLNRKQRDEASGQGDLFESQPIGDVDEYVDEELDILVEEEDSDTEGEIRFTETGETDSESSEEDEREEEGEIEIDFSQFEDADEPKVNLFDEDEIEEEVRHEQESKPSPEIEIPAELSDISDLARPGKGLEVNEKPSAKSTESDLSDLELEDLYFDLGLDDVDKEQTGKQEKPKEVLLALDEIDFSEALAESRSDTSKKSGGMDEDLDFDLDLGGLSIHKDV
jgi:hypothetical protein